MARFGFAVLAGVLVFSGCAGGASVGPTPVGNVGGVGTSPIGRSSPPPGSSTPSPAPISTGTTAPVVSCTNASRRIGAIGAKQFGWQQRFRSASATRPLIANGAQSSLYSGTGPRPGPDILYAPLADAPQLENTGIWAAQPILVSGTSSYRSGEYLYQDFLYDDEGGVGGVDPNQQVEITSPDDTSGPLGTYTYPTNSAYANNAADIVEFRMKPLTDSTAFRMTFNAMTDATLVGFTIGLGSTAAESTMPHNAQTKQIAQVYLTVHGAAADLVDAATGTTLATSSTCSAFTVTDDVPRHQIEVRLPHTLFDPTGNKSLRVSVASGLWDVANKQYLTPQVSSSATMPGGGGASTSAFFNVGFRHAEPYAKVPDSTLNGFRDYAQATALTLGDVSSFFDVVDMTELASGANDDMPTKMQGVPLTGPMSRILASHYQIGNGGKLFTTCDGFTKQCQPEYLGNLQPYAIYVPTKTPPATGYGMTLQLHALTGTYEQLSNMPWQMELGERGTGSIVITPEGRGPDCWYYDLSAADVFEVWADAGARYQLDPAYTAIDGYSMGGYGTFKLSTTYPDLFARAHTLAGTVALQADYSGGTPITGEQTAIPRMLPSLRNLPILMYFAAEDELVPITGATELQQTIDGLKYSYNWEEFNPAEHLTFFTLGIFQPVADFFGTNKVDRDPPHVTYEINPVWSNSSYQLEVGHAYWLSGLTLSDGSGTSPIGQVDVRSEGFGLADPVASAETPITGTFASAGTSYVGFDRTSAAAAAAPVADRLDITTTNVATMTIDPSRARVDCSATLAVTNDTPLAVTLTGCGSKSFARGRAVGRL